MMRAFTAAVFILALLAGCAYTRTVPPEELVVQKVVDAPGMSKEEIFERSKMWFARTFRQPVGGFAQDNWTRSVIRYEDGAKGVLIANGTILYPYRNFSGDTYKEGWEVRFTMEEDVKDGKARLTFSDLIMYVPPHICGSRYPTVTSNYQKELTRDELKKVMPIFLSLPDNLGTYLKGDVTVGKW
jgi:hypothetical protein